MIPGRDDIVAAKTAGYLDGEAFPGEVVDDGQRTEALTVEECVGHEVHAPQLIRRRQDWAVLTGSRRLPSSRVDSPLVSAIHNLRSWGYVVA